MRFSERAITIMSINSSDSAPSGISILVFFTILAMVGVGGYFLLMKLINMSHEEDCILAGRRNCALIAVPADR